VKVTGGPGSPQDDVFVYDALDRRIGKTTLTGPAVWTTYDGDNPYLDAAGSGSLSPGSGGLTWYLHVDGVDELFAREDGAGHMAWYLTDAQGSVRQVVDPSGSPKEDIDRQP
jgi:hypothetical protein